MCMPWKTNIVSPWAKVITALVSGSRWRVHSRPFPMGLCGEKHRFYGSWRLCLLCSQSSHPVPVLLGPLVRDQLNTDAALDALLTWKSKRVIQAMCCCVALEDFPPCFRLSDYKRTLTRDEDDDVAAERQRIYDGGSKTDILQIRDLSKVSSKLTLMYFHLHCQSDKKWQKAILILEIIYSILSENLAYFIIFIFSCKSLLL